MRHLAYAEIKNHTIPFSLSNSTSKVAHFLTTIFGSIYHDREHAHCLNRLDFKEREMFDIFAMLTDIEDTFRSMKSELGLRPVYHQKEYRCDGHLFITVLAYHVAHAIRVQLRKLGIAQSWATIRKGLSTHMRITTTAKRDDGKVIHIRKSTRPEPFHRKIYDALHLSHRPGKTMKTII